MDSNSRGVLLGVFLGVVFVIGLGVLGLNWSAERVKMASLPIEAPILFQPK
jgi:putative Ca2+/H+ antiporter (TMEM165/GDT1 family)